MTIYLLCLILFLVGIYCILTKRNLIKIIIGINISEYAVFLFFILIGYRMGGRAPILDADQVVSDMVDPLPQALVLTAIVISLAVTALMASMAIRLYEKYGTFDIARIRRLKG
jgi:multicomponent Na+:H+ antiporter subunit C